VVEIAPDPAISRYRQLDLFMIDTETDRGFRLDLKHRLASCRAKHLAKPEDWHLHLDRPPALWFGPVTVLMLTALQPVMERLAPRPN